MTPAAAAVVSFMNAALLPLGEKKLIAIPCVPRTLSRARRRECMYPTWRACPVGCLVVALLSYFTLHTSMTKTTLAGYYIQYSS